MKTDEQIIYELKHACTGLMLMSESDFPIEVISLEEGKEPTNEALQTLANEPDALVSQDTIENFFHGRTTEFEGQSETARALTKRYQVLVQTLNENLSELSVHRVGDSANKAVYVIGKSESGAIIGIASRIVET